MRFMTVLGARPQFVKASAVSRVASNSRDIVELIVHTGQHYDANMSDKFFEELGIPAPAIHLGVGSGTHGEQTGRMLSLLDETMRREKPDFVLVYGDTNSTLAGALAAAKLHIPIAHVESGLRSFNRRMPEEINRILTDHMSSLLFAPTKAGVANLAREGITGNLVKNVGDVMYDVALNIRETATTRSEILTQLSLGSSPYVLATIHRAENTDDLKRLKAIVDALSAISLRYDVVIPMHPRTKGRLAGSAISFSQNVRIIEPVGYIDMAALCVHAGVVVTDSGGLQKEAFFHGVPCVTLRDETEWTELIELGWNRLAPPHDWKSIVGAVEEALALPPPTMPFPSPYGDGKASARIVKAMLAMANGAHRR
jgi:UDP-GlcNAc3NAcA epimerase